MSRSRQIAWGAILAASVAAAGLWSLWRAGTEGSEEAGSGRVRFKWAFIHTRATGPARVLDFTGAPRVATGERVRVYLAPLDAATHLYLCMQDSAGKLEIIFPPAPDFYARAGDRAGEYYVPETGAFLLDDRTGIEKFYLFAAPRRLYDLERRMAVFAAAPADGEASAGLLDGLLAAYRRHSGVGRAAVTGVPIAGTVVTRGGEQVSGDATLVEATGCYCAVLRLAHD